MSARTTPKNKTKKPSLESGKIVIVTEDEFHSGFALICSRLSINGHEWNRAPVTTGNIPPFFARLCHLFSIGTPNWWPDTRYVCGGKSINFKRTRGMFHWNLMDTVKSKSMRKENNCFSVLLLFHVFPADQLVLSNQLGPTKKDNWHQFFGVVFSSAFLFLITSDLRSSDSYAASIPWDTWGTLRNTETRDSHRIKKHFSEMQKNSRN